MPSAVGCVPSPPRLTPPPPALVRSAPAAAFGCSPAQGPGSGGPPDSTATAAFLDTLELRTFHYFWDLANPSNGLVPDRWPTPSFSSIAAVGFGLTALPIGVERGYVSRADAAARALATLQFFWTAPQDSAASGATGYHGFFYHFLDMQTGQRYQTVELSTIDTALLLAGALTCQQYFTGTDPTETAVRAYADSVYRRADWGWASPRAPAVSMGWTPEGGFLPSDWVGYDEAMILYLLALGSPTHPVDSTAWAAWTAGYQWGTFEGQSYVQFGPLFGYEYSHVWVDYRGIADAYMAGHGIDYFEDSRRAAYAQRAYAVANPLGWSGYGVNLWGLTASDGPGDVTVSVGGQARQLQGYWARGASATSTQDDGTVAPTAAGAAVPFAPEIALPTLLAMRTAYGARLFGSYGFFDALNPTLRSGSVTQCSVDPTLGWFDTDYLGIDQGAMLAMIENYRTGLIWRLLRSSPYLIRGLRRAGFSGGWLATAP
jgi:hypothetical protein